MQHHGCRSHMRDRNRLTGLEDRFDLVVDSNDAILEKVVRDSSFRSSAFCLSIVPIHTKHDNGNDQV